MINAKVKIIVSRNASEHSEKVNEFLSKIDIRQVVKIDNNMSETDSSYGFFSSIYYIKFEDIRDLKIENILI